MKTVLRSQELTCPSCITKIEKALTTIHGVEQATVHFNTGRIEVQYDPQQTNAQEFEKAIRAIGYEAHVSAF